jgi:hypothetical protein
MLSSRGLAIRAAEVYSAGMLPAEGSVKDGRIIIYLEVKGPGGGNASSKGQGAEGDVSDGALEEKGEGGNASRQDQGAKAGVAQGAEEKKKGKRGAAAKKKHPRAKPVVKPLLGSSKVAAAKNQAKSMRAAAESGAPFCADCAEAHRLLEEAGPAA